MSSTETYSTEFKSSSTDCNRLYSTFCSCQLHQLPILQHSTGAVAASAQEGQRTSAGRAQAEGQSGVKRGREPEQTASAESHESNQASTTGHQPANVNAKDDDAEGGAHKRLRQDVDLSSHTDQVTQNCLPLLKYKLLALVRFESAPPSKC
jgi:hypothetical protein